MASAAALLHLTLAPYVLPTLSSGAKKIKARYRAKKSKRARYPKISLRPLPEKNLYHLYHL